MMEDAKEEAKEEGMSQGENKKSIEIAKNLLSMNMSIEDISKATGLSIEDLQNIKK